MPMVPGVVGGASASTGETRSPMAEGKPSGSSLMMAAATMADLAKTQAGRKDKIVAKKA